jgi:hypothetical protein
LITVLNLIIRILKRLLPFSSKSRSALRNYIRTNTPVQLHEFVLMGSSFHNNPSQMIDKLMQPNSSPLLEKGEFYPLFYDSNLGTLELLSILIEKFRPITVIETGVANGSSTRKILSSFSKSNLINSKLYSIDINPHVATPFLLSNPQFHFICIDSKKSFVNAMYEVGTVDLFYHDSNHSYANQMHEYSIAWEMLNPDSGILMSDDINWSNAFLDFCKKVNRIPILLSDREKFSGIISKPVKV